MTARKRISIKDIAEAAGVSHPTVSRALRGQGRMTNETRERIRLIAHDLGYTPSLVARGLVMQQSYTVGLVVTSFADPFYTSVAQGLEAEARTQGYSVILASTENDPQQEIDVIRSFQGRQVDGIVVSSSRMGHRYAELLEETGVPIVMLNNHVDGGSVYTVYNDDYGGARSVADYLLSAGYAHIAFLGNQRAGRTQAERYRAWQDSMQAAGRTLEVMVYGATGRFSGGADAVDELLQQAMRCWQRAPDAICCYNDTMAIGVMRALRQRGLRTPEDVAVTGFDDIDVAAYLDPGLTTLRQPRFQLGVEAMRTLLEVLGDHDKRGQPTATTLSGELIVRESA